MPRKLPSQRPPPSRNRPPSRRPGVGPKIVEKLNANGVFHFWQIAEWGAADIASMDDVLSFKGRIERDNWIEQATEFAGEAQKTDK
jgi:large subunit ribosomal protein L21